MFRQRITENTNGQEALYIFKKHAQSNPVSNFQIQKVRLNEKIAARKIVYYWNLISLFSARAYVVFDGNLLVHYSIVSHTKANFPFLRKNDIHIGPCWTNPEYRGRGIYPAVLSEITRQELRRDGNAYMIINASNMASQHGALKAGFEKTGDVL